MSNKKQPVDELIDFEIKDKHLFLEFISEKDRCIISVTLEGKDISFVSYGIDFNSVVIFTKQAMRYSFYQDEEMYIKIRDFMRVCSDNGRTSVLHTEDGGSIPPLSTK